MKQKKYGKKIINWHRPFRSYQLSQRYLRNRDMELEENAEYPPDDFLYDPYLEFDDNYWNIYHAADDIDYVVHAAWKLIMQGGGWGQIRSIVSQTEWPSSNRKKNRGESLDEIQAAPERLEERLVEHLRQLTNAKNIEGWLPSTIREAVHATPEDLEILHNIAIESSQEKEGLALTALLFAPFWIRRPNDWVPPDSGHLTRMMSIIDHLFVLYPAPKFLYAEWLDGPDQARMKWLYWFVLLCQGGSLYRAAPSFNWEIPKKFQHHLQDIPSNLTPTEACMCAEIMRLGGTQLEFDRLRANPAFLIDPTSPSSQQSHLPFWRDTVRWLSRHRNSITDEESNLILSWAMHQYTEAQRRGERPFSWHGRSPQRVVEASIEYNLQIERPFSHYTWQRYGWDWELSDDEVGQAWSFMELTSGEELFREGQVMHHCVASYAARCAAGHSAIISVRYGGSRRVTVELNPHTKKIVQARGSRNRSPHPQEQAIIDSWLSFIVHGKPDG